MYLDLTNRPEHSSKLILKIGGFFCQHILNTKLDFWLTAIQTCKGNETEINNLNNFIRHFMLQHV